MTLIFRVTGSNNSTCIIGATYCLSQTWPYKVT